MVGRPAPWRAPPRVRSIASALLLGASSSFAGPVRTDDAAARASSGAPGTPSVAHVWTDALLFAIRHDFARLPVHARNIYHLAAAMHDAWAVHDPLARPLFLGTDLHPSCDVDAAAIDAYEQSPAGATDGATARERSIAQAAWRLLRHRYERAADARAVRDHLDRLAQESGLAWRPGTDDPAGRLGVRVADCLIGAGRRDDSNEDAAYANLDYAPVNPPLDPATGGNPRLVAPSRWQPLAIRGFRDQAGRRGASREFLGADWGAVTPFALAPGDATSVPRDGVQRRIYLDPGPPPRLETMPEAYARQFALVASWSSHLDPADPRLIDIAARGRDGALDPDDLTLDPIAQLAYYASDGGAAVPAPSGPRRTGAAPAPDFVPLGDYARVVAEYWADGIDSETPPGHWLRLYNEHVSMHPRLARRLGGTGPRLDPLAFDIAAYLALGGALHDAAIAAWSIKAAYDYVRPISAIRYLAEPRTVAGPDGAFRAALPIVPGQIERVAIGDPLAGPGGIAVGQIKVRAWRGPTAIGDPARDVAGAGWILARDWWPYQRPSFVTPPFAGYVSGHSAFSRAAAVALERLTGSPRWPGGSAGFTAKADEFLVFERGPSVDVSLRWATYRDAADETGLSRIWGGIDLPADDLRGRAVGARVGEAAWRRVAALYEGGAPGAAAGAVPVAFPVAFPVTAPVTAPVAVRAGGPDGRGAVLGCSIDGASGLPPMLPGLVLWMAWRGRRRARPSGAPTGRCRPRFSRPSVAPRSPSPRAPAPSPDIPIPRVGPPGHRASAAPP